MIRYKHLTHLLTLCVLIALLIGSAATVIPVAAADQTVTNLLDSGPGSLRQAIIDVASGGTISFDPSLSGETVELTSTTLMIEKSLTIDGSSLPDQITISGSHNMHVLQVNALVTVTLDSLMITDGKAKYGSGIDNMGSLTVNNCTIYGNEALYEGGGIRNLGTLVVTNSTLSDNLCTNLSTNADGGGIYSNGVLTILNSAIVSNHAKSAGGGIYNIGNLTLTNSTISRNSAFDGGGIYNNAVMNVLNSTIFKNSAGCLGGGIFNQGTLNFSNTIIANSLLSTDCYNNGGSIGIANSNNIVVNNATLTNDCGTPYSTDDPLLGILANNGGPTSTHALLVGSPAIDTGDAGVCPTTDQRGLPRPIGLGCDIGAFEYGFAVFLPLVTR